MPTRAECEELIDNTTHIAATVGGVGGTVFRSKQNSSNKTFLPAAGSYTGGELYEEDFAAHWWSSSADPPGGYYLSADGPYCGVDTFARYVAQSVRGCIMPS